MSTRRILALLFLLGTFQVVATAQETIRVRIRTGTGIIGVELYPDKAPGTVENFLRYVDGGFYEGGRFHRAVTLDNQPDNDVLIEVIQAGIDTVRSGEGFDPIPLERTRVTGLRHEDGTISMARGGPDSARSDFFICIEDQPSLDFGGDRNPDGQGFAAFGKVIDGMEVVRAIQSSPVEEQRLTPPVGILSIERLQQPE